MRYTLRFFTLFFILIVVCLLFLVGSQGPEPKIEVPAREMNLSLSDLGADWSLALEQDLDELLPTLGQDDDIVDANRRLFVSSKGDMLASVVMNARTAAAARREMQANLVNSWRADVQQQLPDATLEELAPPDVGDEAVMFRVQAPVQGGQAPVQGGQAPVQGVQVPIQGAVLYGLAFRQANVFAMIVTRGSQEFTTAKNLTDHALQLETKIH
jgi:hypothetical protein